MKRKKLEELESDRVSILRDGKIGYLDMYPKLSIFQETYDRCMKECGIIEEWTKNLYVPQNFLRDIMKKIHESIGPLIITYSLKSVLKLSSTDWKLYDKFKEDLSHFDEDQFKIVVIYGDDDLEALRATLVKQKFDMAVIHRILSSYEKGISSFVLQNTQHKEIGCIVVINGTIVKKDDLMTLEQKLDHELNHYFSSFSFEHENSSEDLALDRRIEKIGADAGYDLSNEFLRSDFISHMLEESEFLPMVSNICNVLEAQCEAEDKYMWLVKHSTSSFLKTKEYLSLSVDLQNILLFSTICRAYSQRRWHRILEATKEQFNKEVSFSENTKCGILTFIEKLKRIF